MLLSVLKPNLFPNRQGPIPPDWLDPFCYVALSHVELRGVDKVKDLVPPEQLAELARFANGLERKETTLARTPAHLALRARRNA